MSRVSATCILSYLFLVLAASLYHDTSLHDSRHLSEFKTLYNFVNNQVVTKNLYGISWSISQLIRSIIKTTATTTTTTTLESSSHLSRLADKLEEEAWKGWEQSMSSPNNNHLDEYLLEIPIFDLNLGMPNATLVKTMIEERHGTDWKSRPLLFRNMWTEEQLQSSDRKLTLEYMMTPNSTPNLAGISIPYYGDSTRIGYDALSPDSNKALGDIVREMLHGDDQHKSTSKVGSQLIMDAFPQLIEEVAPSTLMTQLFGDFFRPHHLKGSGPFGLFPATTTVPIFLSRLSSNIQTKQEEFDLNNIVSLDDDENHEDNNYEIFPETMNDNNNNIISNSSTDAFTKRTIHTRTDLHSEPIGNIAVQLHGEKSWTLISPHHSHLLRPTISRHGRAFFYSTLNPLDARLLKHIPRYQLVTHAGDALWVPPWTWHRVDYYYSRTKNKEEANGYDQNHNTFREDEIEEAAINSMEDGTGTIAFAASLFHFRPSEFFLNNPLMAILIIPNIIKEVLGLNME